jgi:hypothetical protein
MADTSYEQILLDQRETLVDTLGRALAGLEGPPLDSKTARPEDEDAAWEALDRRVTPQHLAAIAEQTVAELAQQTDETGAPQWTPDEVATEVKARQTAARYPYRHLTYSLGLVDPAEQAAKAERVRARVERKRLPQLTEAGWVEVPDDYQPPGLADLMGTGAPAQQQATPGQTWNY